MRLFWVWLWSAVGLYIVTRLSLGIEARTLSSVIVASVVLGLVNLLVRPLVRLVAFPITLLTLGLFGWVINALMLWLVAAVVPGFHVAGFLPALWGSIILAIISGVLNWGFRKASR